MLIGYWAIGSYSSQCIKCGASDINLAIGRHKKGKKGKRKARKARNARDAREAMTTSVGKRGSVTAVVTIV